MDKTISAIDSSGRKWEVLSSNSSQYDLSFKVIILGNSDVGKERLTSLIVTKFQNEFHEGIGSEFVILNLRTEDKVIKLQIWDTCGREIYKSLIANFYQNSSLGVMVYSIDNRESFEDISQWLKEYKEQCPENKVVLIGNNSHFEEARCVYAKEGEKFKDDFQLAFFMESPLKTCLDAINIYIEVARTLYQDYLQPKGKSDLPKGGPKPFLPNDKTSKHPPSKQKRPGCLL